MSDSFRSTIDELERHLEDLQAQTADTMRTINSLCRVLGEAPRYQESDATVGAKAGSQLNGDEYYGKPLASVVRTILENRKVIGKGPATVAEIYDTMKLGGYVFEAKNAENAKRGLRISLAKNSTTFHKLPSGKFGLLEWYPAAKDNKPKNGDSPETSKDEEEELVAVGEGGAMVDEADASPRPSKPK